MLALLPACGSSSSRVFDGPEVGLDAPGKPSADGEPDVAAFVDAPTVDVPADSGVDAGNSPDGLAEDGYTGSQDANASGFFVIGNLPYYPHSLTANRLSDDRILLGLSLYDFQGGSTLLFDGDTGAQLDYRASPSDVLGVHPATTILPDNRILFAGGNRMSMASYTAQSAAAIWDPATMTLAPSAPLLFRRAWPTATTLLDGTALFTGSIQYPRSVLDSAEIYDPAKNTMTLTLPMAGPRNRHAAVLLSSGKVLIVGGYSLDDTAAAALPYDPAALVLFGELYDPATKAFAKTGSLAHGRLNPTSIRLQDGRVLVTGGRLPNNATQPDAGGTVVFDTAEIYDLATGEFTKTGDLATARYDHAASLLPDGRVLILGGVGPSGAALSSAELYDPKTGLFHAAGSMHLPRRSPIALALSNGKVVIVGTGPTIQDPLYIEQYDPAFVP